MEIKTKYITADDFKEYFGIDLELELKNSANPSDTVNAFLKRIEDRIAIYLDAMFYRNVDEEYPEFSDLQKECYSKALLEQAIYVFRNGDLSVDSGVDYDRGEVLSNDTINKKIIAPNCKMYLLKCGLWNRTFRKTHNAGIGGLF